VEVAVDWTAGDVAREAAEMWEQGWEPSAQGGTLLLSSPGGRDASLADVFWDERDPSWPAYAEAVWARLVDVCAAMLDRRGRRALRSDGGGRGG
jgi:hypothetical protein